MVRVGENPVKAGTLFTQLICLGTQLWSMRVPAFTRLNETAGGSPVALKLLLATVGKIH